MKVNKKPILSNCNIPRLQLIFYVIVSLVIIFLNTAFVYADSFKPSTIVMTFYGEVEGYIEANGVLAWKGIPYAKAPVDDLRWEPPQDPEPWGYRETINDCYPCTQFGTTGVIGSEDCLYLNIFRPNNNKIKLPVYFWIHGGSNNTGNAAIYNGSQIAKKLQMVVVVIQYRLGPLGWLSHPCMRDDGDSLKASGNFGTLDTIKALEWVQDNIKAFGGNPDNIVIAGESAGSHNVMNLVISPLGAGLFHKAISESGGMKTSTVANGDAWTEETINNLLNGGNYPSDVESFLRGKSAAEIFIARVGTTGSMSAHSAYQDGIVIPIGGVVATIESGDYNKVPIILGSNEDEMKYFLRLYGPALKVAYMNPIYGIDDPIPSGSFTWGDVFFVFYGLPLSAVFPTDNDKALYEACAVFGSLNWRYNFVDLIARPLREKQNKVYAYLFKWDGVEGSDYDFILGSAHATEIPFFFGGESDIFGGVAFNPANDTPGRQTLSEAMMNYIGKFARSGNPNGSGLPVWQQWSNKPGKSKAIVFNATEMDIDIHMISEEITADDVDAKFWQLYFSLPEETQNALFWFDWY